MKNKTTRLLLFTTVTSTLVAAISIGYIIGTSKNSSNLELTSIKEPEILTNQISNEPAKIDPLSNKNNLGNNQTSDGPSNHQVLLATSKDGLSWEVNSNPILTEASVPDMILTTDNKIRIYYVDGSVKPEKTNCAESEVIEIKFYDINCSFEGFEENARLVDPSIVQLSDGRYRLYAYLAEGKIDGSSSHKIVSSISNDGINFEYEQTVFEYDGLVDPDVFYVKNQWVMYVYSITDKTTLIATSTDGLNFTYYGPATDLIDNGTTGGFTNSDGDLVMYTFSQGGGKANNVNLYADSDKTGLKWNFVKTLFTAEGFDQFTDPQVVILRDGSYLMTLKTRMSNRI